MQQLARSKGITLLEVLVAVAIVGIMSNLAIPSFTGLIQGSAAENAAKRLHQALIHARQEARTRGQSVTIHSVEGYGQYAGELETYVNTSGEQDDYRAGEDIYLRNLAKVSTPVLVYHSSNAGNWINFGPRGQLSDDDNTTELTVIFCAVQDPQVGHRVQVNQPGRIRYDIVDKTECKPVGSSGNRARSIDRTGRGGSLSGITLLLGLITGLWRRIERAKQPIG